MPVTALLVDLTRIVGAPRAQYLSVPDSTVVAMSFNITRTNAFKTIGTSMWYAFTSILPSFHEEMHPS